MTSLDQSSATGFRFPELKSILAVFVGLFCVLCFKKLIGFGRRWKNIIIDWGYRSLNVPSLWSSDTVAESSNATETGPGLQSSGTGHDAKYWERVPALRLPDAWPNFLLTWMYLNLDTITSLIPAWTSAINHDLTKLVHKSTADDTSTSPHPASPYSRVELKAVLRPSFPPRLSSIETSASGSTRELHFRCALSSEDVFLQLCLTKPPPPSSDTNDHGKSVEDEQLYVVHLHQVSCRIQLICAVLEGGYVLLSWKLVSPLLTQRLSLLDMDRKPVTHLNSVDVRWIKDTIYLGIQSAVTRIVVNPLCLTPVQHNLSTRQWPVTFPTQSVTSTNSTHTTVGHTPATYPVSPVLDNAILIRVMYAVLLEPTQPDAVDSLMRHQLLRCRIQRSSFTPVGSASNDGDEVEKQKENADTFPDDNLLMVTNGVPLESKSWSAEPQSNSLGNRPISVSSLASGMGATSYMATWNQEAFIPLEKITSDLLHVVLFTEPDSNAPDQSTTSQLCGHAILPLPKLDEVQSKSQHVLLIDFHAGQSLTDTWRCSPPIRSDARAKFMLILRAYLVSHESPISEQQIHHTSSAILDEPHGLRNRILTPVCNSNAWVTTDCSYVDSVHGAYSTKPVGIRCPTDSESVNSSRHATPPHSNTVGLSTEQLTHFMSPSLLADWKSDLYARTSSCELSRTSSAEPEPTALSDRAESPMTQTSFPRKQLIMNSSPGTTHKLGELSDISSSAVALSPFPTQASVSVLPKTSFSHDNLANSHVDNLTRLPTKSRKKARWFSIRLPRSHKRELLHGTPPSSDGRYVSEGSKNAPGSPTSSASSTKIVDDIHSVGVPEHKLKTKRRSRLQRILFPGRNSLRHELSGLERSRSLSRQRPSDQNLSTAF